VPNHHLPVVQRIPYPSHSCNCRNHCCPDNFPGMITKWSVAHELVGSSLSFVSVQVFSDWGVCVGSGSTSRNGDSSLALQFFRVGRGRDTDFCPCWSHVSWSQARSMIGSQLREKGETTYQTFALEGLC